MSGEDIFDRKIHYVGNVIESRDKVKGPYISQFHVVSHLKRYFSSFDCFNTLHPLKKKMLSLFNADVIWMEYPCGRFPGMMVCLASLVTRSTLILQVYDLPIEQRKYLLNRDRSRLNKMQFRLIERILASKAENIIFSSPGFIEWIRTNGSRIFVFPPGICREIIPSGSCAVPSTKEKHILAYAGSLDRGGMIEELSCLFADLEGWEFWIAGEGAEVVDNNRNTRYLGFISYMEVQKLYERAHAIVIPYPAEGYYDICVPLKIGEVLASLKPVIMMRLTAVEMYLKAFDLMDNVIFVDNWNKEEIEAALDKAALFRVDKASTLKKLEHLYWDDRTERLIEKVFIDRSGNDGLEWI